MTYLRLALALLLSLAAGYFLVDLLLHKTRIPGGLKVSLAIGLGLGLTSLSYFAWRLLDGPEGWLYFGLELLLVLGIGLAWSFARRRFPERETLQPPVEQVRLPAAWRWLVDLSLLVSAFLGGLVYVFGTLVFPHGSFDAWAIWNLAARFLASGPQDWRLLFDPAIFHSDYPLLVGSSVARLWAYRSVVDLSAPALVGLLFSLGTFGLLLSLANLARGGLASRLAGLALLGSSSLLVIAPTQCVDVPLGYYLLGALGMLALHQRSPRTVFLLAAGVFLGLGIWTKNEGWLLALAVLSGWLVSGLLGRGERRMFRSRLQGAGWVLAGMLPAAALALVQKGLLAPPNDLLAAQGGESLARLADPARWLQIGREFGVLLVSLEAKYSAPLGLLVLLALIFGIRQNAFSRAEVWANLITLGIALGGYFLVYLASPHDLNWHLSTALFRLYAQLWPSAVFTLILLIRLPGDAPLLQRRPAPAVAD